MPDYMGFIYYPHSRRYAGALPAAATEGLPESIRKVGVFVDQPSGEVLATCAQMGFHAVQLHGREAPDYCRRMRDEGFEVFKAFNIGNETGFGHLKEYRESCDLFLLDTAGNGFGGTGKKFDWERLAEYELDKPFFLSGGIGPQDAGRILLLDHPDLFGVDLNSRFETEPGMKDRHELAGFIRKIREG